MAQTPDHGIHAPGVIRNFFGIGAVLILLIVATPAAWHIGPVELMLHPMFAWSSGWLPATGLRMLLPESLQEKTAAAEAPLE